MKILVTSYAFNAASKTVTFSGYGSISLDHVLLITNTTTNVIIYNFSNPALGGTVSTNVLTLTYDTTSMSNTDKLQIFYWDTTATQSIDDGGGSITTDLNVVEVTGTGGALNDTPIAATQVDKYASVRLQIGGTFTATNTFEVSQDGTNWKACGLFQATAGSVAKSSDSGISANTVFYGPLTGKYFRVRTSSYTSGTVTAIATFSTASIPLNSLSVSSGSTIGIVASGNTVTSNSSIFGIAAGLDTNLLGTLGTAFSTAGKVDIKSADGDLFVRQATGTNLHTVVDSGTISTITNVVHIDDGGNSITVDAPVGTPVFTRLSDGSAALIGQKAMSASLPVVLSSDQASIPVASTLTAETTKVIGTVNVAASQTIGLSTGTNSIGKISDITTSIVPGTGATNLGKAEDASHSSSDTGVFILGVRNSGSLTDSQLATFTNADIDYTPIAVDNNGAVMLNWKNDAVTGTVTATGAAGFIYSEGYPTLVLDLSLPAGATVVFQLTMDGSTFLTASGTNIATSAIETGASGAITNSRWVFNIAGFYAFRLNTTAYTSGTGNIRYSKNRSDSSFGLIPDRIRDSAGNLLTSNSSTYTAKFGLDANLLGTLGTAFSTAGKVDVKGADGDLFVRQATASNLNMTEASAASILTKLTAGAASMVKLEDVASADADAGCPAMAVRKATPVNTSGTDGDYEMLQMSAGRLWVDPSGVTLTTNATLSAETTKAIGVVRNSDGSGNLITSNSTTYTAKFAPDCNLLGTLGTAFSTAGKVDVKGADGDMFVRQATASNLNATVVGTGTFATQLTPSTSGGLTTFHLISAATTNLTVVKAGVGQLYGWYVYNNAATVRKIAFHNTTSTPTAGASVFFSVVFPPNSGANVEFSNGIPFSTGIAISTVTGIADNDTVAVALNDLTINLFYK